ncbi:MAG: helix-turn-helix domain-containing protein [Acidobacteria bacterium]|nr:helix-turn-helix domain-containing protein [Bryobacteraceae bacterium CoA2 C42]
MQVLLLAHIQERLVEELRRRVRNGETTERALAKLTGVSQPHMHNVLKGQRLLSSELADAILGTLQLSVLDLFDRQQMTAFLNRQANLQARAVAIPVLEGLLGPGYPLPRQVPSPEVYTIPYEQAASATQPIVARLAADPDMAGLFGEGDLILLDQSETLRKSLLTQGFYVVNTPAGALVRAIRRESEELCLWSGFTNGPTEARETRIPLAGLDLLGLVLARVVWLNQRRRWNDLPAGA